MLVPRSYKYGASPPSLPKDVPSAVSQSRNSNNTSNITINTSTLADSRMPSYASLDRRSPKTRQQLSTPRSVTEPLDIPTKAAHVSDVSRLGTSQKMTGKRSGQSHTTRRASEASGGKHRPDAMSPSVAALLAITAIPPPRPHQLRRRGRTTTEPQPSSIDELVNYWKADHMLSPSMSSSPSLSVLLESADDLEDTNIKASDEESDDLHARSTSSDSVPSLDADQKSVVSTYAPSTPASLRSRRSMSNLRRDRLSKSLPAGEDCARDHPLGLSSSNEAVIDESPTSFRQIKSTPRAKPKSTFRSNLTTSLQALRAVALNSLSSFTSSNSSANQSSDRTSQDALSGFADDALWSHPFLFPRFSPEVRPTIQGTPTQAQRRYLNPMPLTFEEQEAPFQQALHAPFLAEHIHDAPAIQLQTYTRARRRPSNRSRSGSSDPQSEAGRALSSVSGIRQREARENSDFLRVVVLEMNMRREGKLEMGRARIWLPPRQVGERGEAQTAGKVPVRWLGVSAE